MISTSKRFSLLLLSTTALFLLLSSPAWANASLGIIAWGMIGVSPSVYIGFVSTWVASILVVLVEAIVLRWMFEVGWLRAIWLALILNAISTVLGLLYGYFTFVIPLGFITLMVLVVWWAYDRKHIPWWVVAVTAVSMIIGFIASIRSSFTYLPALRGIAEYSGYVLPLLLGFGLSLFVEGASARSFYNGSRLWRGILTANILSHLLLAAMAVYYGPGELNQIGYSEVPGGWRARARGMLRSIGSAQLAYQSATSNKIYGSFEALQDVEDIAAGYTLGNMIENYSLTWDVNNVSTAPTEEFPGGIISTFTVIAYPKDTRPGSLVTFVVTEDQTVRFYNPGRRNDPDAVRSWDPAE